MKLVNWIGHISIEYKKEQDFLNKKIFDLGIVENKPTELTLDFDKIFGTQTLQTQPTNILDLFGEKIK